MLQDKIAGILLIVLLGSSISIVSLGTGLEAAGTNEKTNSSATITVSVDKAFYKRGEQVTVQGKVSNVVEKFVSVAILDPEKKSFLDTNLSLADDGSYKVDFIPKVDDPIGEYTVNVVYMGQMAVTEFLVESELKQGLKEVPKDTSNGAIDLKYGKKEYQVVYNISNGKIRYLQLDTANKALVVFLNSTANGKLEIMFPREMLDARNDNKDTGFKVLADNKVIIFKDTTVTTLTRGLTLTFPNGTEEIKIIGTYIITYSAQDPSNIKRTSTIIAFDPPVSQVSEGDTALFTGRLETENNVIQGAKIWIKYADKRGAEHFLASAITDAAGKFSAKWSSKIIAGFTSMDVYATFSGNDDYLPAKSESFNITIDKQKSKTIVAYTDKKMYDLGDFVTISGKVNDIKQSGIVGIDIINPEGRYLKTAQTPIKDSFFSWKFRLDGRYAMAGTYTVTASYWHETSKTSFLLDGEDVKETIQTVLQLSPPSMVIEKGDVLSFTGSLMSSDESVAIPNATVWIKYIGDAGQDHKLVSTTTNDKGKFVVKWQSNLNTSGKIHMYASFEGERLFASTVSKEYVVTLDGKPEPLVAKSDKRSYTFGETVKITGSVAPVGDLPVLIQVLDSQDLPLRTDFVDVSSNGSFKHEFSVDGELASFGTYKIKVTYNEISEILQIRVTQPKAGFITIENMTFVDSINMPINKLRTDEKVFLKSVMKNNLNMDQSFVGIMQIQNSENVTVLIKTSQYMIPKGGTFVMEVPWTPESSGNFTVNVFLLQTDENPLALSLRPASLQTSVY